MKNWLKNLLFVVFSFVFLGVGILIANILIHERGNPLRDPDFLTDNSVNSTTLPPLDSTAGRLGDTIQVPELVAKKPPTPQSFTESPKQEKDYDVVVGIFGQRSNADKHLKKLKNLGFDNAYSYSKSSKNVVSAGQFAKIKAQRVALDLHDKGFETILKRR